jgi:hypothetical protein
VYITPYTEIVNFRSDGKELIRLIKFVKNFNLCNLHNKPGCHVVSKVVKIQEYRSRRHVIVETDGHVIRKPHTFAVSYYAVHEKQLTCINQVSRLNVTLDHF